MHSIVYGTRAEAEATLDTITGMVTIAGRSLYSLFDIGASHSFISVAIVLFVAYHVY